MNQQQPDLYPFITAYTNEGDEVNVQRQGGVVMMTNSFLLPEVEENNNTLRLAQYTGEATNRMSLQRTVVDTIAGLPGAPLPLIFRHGPDSSMLSETVVLAYNSTVTDATIKLYHTNIVPYQTHNYTVPNFLLTEPALSSLFYDNQHRVYVGAYNATTLTLNVFELNILTEQVQQVKALELNDATISYCEVTIACDKQTLHITYISGRSLFLRTALVDDPENVLSKAQLIYNSLDIVPPAPQLVLSNDQLSLFYGANRDSDHVLRFGNSTITRNRSGNAIGMDIPIRSLLSRSKLNETKDVTQSNQRLHAVGNVYNNRFQYVAYVTTGNEVCVVKLYEHENKTLRMWATRPGVFASNVVTDFQLVCGDNGTIALVYTENNAAVRFYRIDEFSMDLGHSIGTITALTNTVPQMLDELTQYSLNANVPVVIDTVEQVANQTRLTFRYLSFNNIDALNLADNVALTLQTFLRTLYRNSNIQINNVDGQFALSGDDDNTVAFLPRGTTARPCVARGTDVFLCISDHGETPRYKVVSIEEIDIGDRILTDTGKPGMVLMHLSTKILTEEHNAPYIVPVNFFDSDIPYKPLMISGDHAIKVGQKGKVLPSNIGVLQRFPLQREVEYHHLAIEDDAYFIANGVAVESYVVS